MVAEAAAVVQIAVVVALDAPLQGIVERGVEMVILSADAQHVPGVAVADAALRRGLAQRHDAPEAEPVTQGLDGLGNALAHADALRQRAEDLVGVGLFELVIAHLLQNKIMDGELLLKLRLALQGRVRRESRASTACWWVRILLLSNRYSGSSSRWAAPGIHRQR